MGRQQLVKIISLPLWRLHTTKWRERATIPNQAGFVLWAMRLDGVVQETTVKVDGDGCHFLDNLAINQVSGWIPAEECDQ